MLLRHRRFFAILGFLVIATLLIWGMILPDSAGLILKDGRRPTPAPPAPESLARYAAFPGQVDAYLKDHFGLRHAMIRTISSADSIAAGSTGSNPTRLGRRRSDASWFAGLGNARKGSLEKNEGRAEL